MLKLCHHPWAITINVTHTAINLTPKRFSFGSIAKENGPFLQLSFVFLKMIFITCEIIKNVRFGNWRETGSADTFSRYLRHSQITLICKFCKQTVYAALTSGVAHADSPWPKINFRTLHHNEAMKTCDFKEVLKEHTIE